MNNYNLGNVKDYKCRGGCQVRKMVQYGEIKDVDPLCPKDNQEKIKDLNVSKKSEFEKFNKVAVVHSL